MQSSFISGVQPKGAELVPNWKLLNKGALNELVPSDVPPAEGALEEALELLPIWKPLNGGEFELQEYLPLHQAMYQQLKRNLS